MSLPMRTPEQNAPNVRLLRKYVKWVEKQEKLAASKRIWKQDVWLARANKNAPACQTAMCLAGKVVTDHGWKPLWQSRIGYAGDLFGVASEWDSRAMDFEAVSFSKVVKGGKVRTVEGAANEILGLPKYHSLFEGDNDAEDIRIEAERLVGRYL